MRALAALVAEALVASACSRSPPPGDPLPPGATVIVKVPAAIRIARDLETLTASFDPAALASTTLPVAPGMVVGMEVETVVFAMGSPRPEHGSIELHAPPGVDVTSTWSAKEGIPAPGKRYVVEMEVTIFETDVPVGHHWSPRSGRFHPLWTRSLRQTEE